MKSPARSLALRSSLPMQKQEQMSGQDCLISRSGQFCSGWRDLVLSEQSQRVASSTHPDRWSINVIKEPAQNPDMNVNDLGFFRSLKTRIEEIKQAAMMSTK